MGRPRIKTIEITQEVKEPKVQEVQETVEQLSNLENPEKKKTAGKVKRTKVRSKGYLESLKQIDKTKAHPLQEALSIIKNVSKRKFDATFEAHFNLGIDPTKTDQKVRGLASLPHGSGKEIKVLVFGIKSSENENVIAGDDTTLDQIEKGKTDFDKVISTPEWMTKLAKVAKILGPKGLMPNPKSGTVTDKPEQVLKDLQGGAIEFKSENQPVVHASFGKVSWKDPDLIENFKALHQAILKAKPESIKKSYLKNVYLTSTMSPSVKLDLSSLNP